MTTPEDLLAELGRVATDLAPAVRPVGSEDLLRALTDTARQLFGAAACSLALLSDDESELVYTTAAGEGADDITGMRMPVSEGVAGWVVQSGQPIAIGDLANDPRFSLQTAQRTGYVPQAILAVPVNSPRRTLGVLTLLDRDARRPGAEHDMTLLSLFADQAAIALESVLAFGDLGRVLLQSVAVAAGDGTDLAGAADRSAAELTGADADLAGLAAAFATLSRRGAAERRLAHDVMHSIATYAERRSPRTR
ncbi:MAG TPA: GAF domain-containing protein [Mycobacteriales bacterium]|nr:GAF domain-containing protein [Mycobacteriales bacterium]